MKVNYFLCVKGTGKTKTIVGLVLQLVHQRKHPGRTNRILICTPSNAAIDEIMRRLIQAVDSLPNTLCGGRFLESKCIICLNSSSNNFRIIK